MAKKPLQAIAKKIEKKGTKGALRAQAGLSKDEKFTPEKLAAMKKHAESMPKGEERTKLMRRVIMAQTFMKHSKG